MDKTTYTVTITNNETGEVIIDNNDINVSICVLHDSNGVHVFSAASASPMDIFVTIQETLNIIEGIKARIPGMSKLLKLYDIYIDLEIQEETNNDN